MIKGLILIGVCVALIGCNRNRAVINIHIDSIDFTKLEDGCSNVLLVGSKISNKSSDTICLNIARRIDGYFDNSDKRVSNKFAVIQTPVDDTIFHRLKFYNEFDSPFSEDEINRYYDSFVYSVGKVNIKQSVERDYLIIAPHSSSALNFAVTIDEYQFHSVDTSFFNRPIVMKLKAEKIELNGNKRKEILLVSDTFQLRYDEMIN